MPSTGWALLLRAVGPQQPMNGAQRRFPFRRALSSHTETQIFTAKPSPGFISQVMLLGFPQNTALVLEPLRVSASGRKGERDVDTARKENSEIL